MAGNVTQLEPGRLSSIRAAMLALVAVVAIALGSLAATCLVMRDTIRETDSLVGSSLRSVQLVGDLRENVERLATAAADDAGPIVRELKVDIAAYRALASEVGEAEALAVVEVGVQQLVDHRLSFDERIERIFNLHHSLARLVRINTRAAADTTRRIRNVQESALYAQIVAAALTVVAVVVVASVLLRVMRRKRELVSRQFEKLDERNRDLSEFVDRTAHDLRGPLTPIRGYADMLAAGSADVAKAASRIKSSSEHMEAIIDDLLLLSTAGHLPPGEAELVPLVGEVLDDLGGELADAEVHVHVDENRVGCAPGVLRQLLYNVVTNASKYRSPDRKLVLEVDGHRTDGVVEVAIADNGIGIAPTMLERVFDPYYRAPEVRQLPGSGLGLAIVRRMVMALGGSCEMTSEVGRGSRFVMRLPLAPPVTVASTHAIV